MAVFASRDAAELRSLVGHLIGDSSDERLVEVLALTNDFDLAATAIEMCPRPAWVEAIVGVRPALPDFPPEDYEF